LRGLVGATARPEWIGTVAVLAGGVTHALRLRFGLAMQNTAVVLSLLLIGGLIGFGATRLQENVQLDAFVPDPQNIPAFAATLVWISFAYSGWNAAVYVAGEVRDPDRNIHRALALATAAVTLIYMSLNAVFVYAAPVDALAGRAEIGAVAAEELGGRRARAMVSLAVAAALFTSISSLIMAGSRVCARMAEDGFLPRRLAQAGDVPSAAVVAQIALALLAVWNSRLVELLGYIGFTLGLSAAATVGGLLRLRRREGAERVPVPGYPWVPAGFIASTLITAAFLTLREPRAAGIGLLTVATGIPAYWLLARRQAPQMEGT
jgi:amino acid transporter